MLLTRHSRVTSDLCNLEKAQRYCAKTIQGMPQQTHVPVPAATLGWPSVEAVLDIAKMVFLYRWLTLSTSCIYRKMAFARLVSFIYGDDVGRGGPLYGAFVTFRKYGAEHLIIDMLTSGKCLSLKGFKKWAREHVLEVELTRWRSTRVVPIPIIVQSLFCKY